jgi:hypothetical protein
MSSPIAVVVVVLAVAWFLAKSALWISAVLGGDAE